MLMVVMSGLIIFLKLHKIFSKEQELPFPSTAQSRVEGTDA